MDSIDMSLSELREMVMDREAWHAVIHGVTKSRTRLSDWTELNCVKKQSTIFFNFASFLFLYQNKLNCNSLFVAIVISHVTILHKAESLVYMGIKWWNKFGIQKK